MLKSLIIISRQTIDALADGLSRWPNPGPNWDWTIKTVKEILVFIRDEKDEPIGTLGAETDDTSLLYTIKVSADKGEMRDLIRQSNKLKHKARGTLCGDVVACISYLLKALLDGAESVSIKPSWVSMFQWIMDDDTMGLDQYGRAAWSCGCIARVGGSLGTPSLESACMIHNAQANILAYFGVLQTSVETRNAKQYRQYRDTLFDILSREVDKAARATFRHYSPQIEAMDNAILAIDAELMAQSRSNPTPTVERLARQRRTSTLDDVFVFRDSPLNNQTEAVWRTEPAAPRGPRVPSSFLTWARDMGLDINRMSERERLGRRQDWTHLRNAQRLRDRAQQDAEVAADLAGTETGRLSSDALMASAQAMVRPPTAVDEELSDFVSDTDD